VDRGKGGSSADKVVDASGIPLGTVTASRPKQPRLAASLGETLYDAFGGLPEHSGVHLERAYDSKVTREILERRSLVGVISKKGEPAPLKAGMRWVVGMIEGIRQHAAGAIELLGVTLPRVPDEIPAVDFPRSTASP
jgi:hypothetical protein